MTGFAEQRGQDLIQPVPQAVIDCGEDTHFGNQRPRKLPVPSRLALSVGQAGAVFGSSVGLAANHRSA